MVNSLIFFPTLSACTLPWPEIEDQYQITSQHDQRKDDELGQGPLDTLGLQLRNDHIYFLRIVSAGE